MMKKVMTLLLAGVLAAGMTACGSSSSSGTAAPAGSGSTPASSAEGGVDWPKKPVNIIVPFSAGGDTDFNARTMAQYLSEELGVSVVVSNVTGSGGSIASNQVKSSANDGYTILCNHATLNMNTASGIIDWDYSDLQMGGIFAIGQPEAVIVRGDAPWNTIEELIADSKANPGTYTMSASTGATTQWAPIALNHAGAQLNIVDAGSASDRIPALLGGHVDVITNSLATVKDYLATGEFKCLATCGTARTEAYPDIPTLAECGIDCSYDQSYTFFFPAGTDAAIVAKLEAAVKNVVENNADYAKAIAEAYDQTPTMYSIADSEVYYADMLAKLMEISDILQGKA